jgi:KipI family sensor histidine kinase inhibitor
MKVHSYGEHALLAEVDDPHTVPALRAALAQLDDVVDAVAGACTVLAILRPGAEQAVRAALDSGEFAGWEAANSPECVVVPVVYDGADLDDVGRRTGLAPAEVIALHSGGRYVVRFCGFSPGFAYLDGLDERLHLPRRSEPRTAVPAGSVGIAGEFTGIYPRRSPGGWQLLGSTDLALWDVARKEPALLVPGTRVRFEPA